MLGTLCAGAREEVDASVELQLPDVELAADLLATVLTYELRLEAAARRAEQAEAVAQRDALTGVGNRRAWDAALDAEEARPRRLGSTASVLVLDLDGLKELNDTRGHEAGDALIVRTAEVLRTGGTHDSGTGTGAGDFLEVLPHPVGDAELNARIDRLLDTARRQLGMDAAVLAQFHGGRWTLRHARTAPGVPDPRGFSTHRGGTYCQRVLEGYLAPSSPTRPRTR